jgi:membrane-associated phospholipid phosphatase
VFFLIGDSTLIYRFAQIFRFRLQMKEFFRKNKGFYIPYFIFFCIGAILLLSYSRVEIHLYINRFHHLITDIFFKLFTHAGDGIVLAIAIPVLLFIKYRYAIVLALSNICITIIVQSFKRFILPEIDRPVLVFYNVKKLYLVDGITHLTDHSFPSGHSATGFGLYLLFALITRNQTLKFIFFMIAFLVAFSRIYLSQHFFNDIYFGSLFGTLCTTSIYLWSEKWNKPKLEQSLRDAIKLRKNDDQKQE